MTSERGRLHHSNGSGSGSSTNPRTVGQGGPNPIGDSRATQGMGSLSRDCKMGCCDYDWIDDSDHRPFAMDQKGLMKRCIKCAAILLGIAIGLVITFGIDMVFIKGHYIAAQLISYKGTCMAMCH